MTNENNKLYLIYSKTPAEIRKMEDQKRLDRVANEAAEQTGKTEPRYDRGFDIFTK
jgi:hypothetical protein